MKHLTIKKIITSVLFCVMCSVLSVKWTRAQEVSFSFTPSLTELAIKPGQSISLNYKLVNHGDPTIAVIRSKPFTAKGNIGNITLEQSGTTPILLKLEKQPFDLDEAFFFKNSETRNFSVMLTVPPGTANKDYYLSLIAESQPPPTEEGTINVRAKFRVLSNLLISVTENARMEIKPKIVLFELTPTNKFNFIGNKVNLFNSFSKIPVIFVIGNTGKNLIKPRGEITIKGFLAKDQKLELKPQNVLSESQRLFSVEFPGYLIGSYAVTSTISFGPGTPALYASASFLVLPYKLIFLIPFVLIYLIFLINKSR